MITRIVVAHDAGARVFDHLGPRKGLALLEEIDFEEGRRQNKEIGTDRPGRTFASVGQVRHAYEPRQALKEIATESFAKQLAQSLERGLNEHAFREIVLIAPPRFLGKLRESLSDSVAKCVVASIAKDLPLATTEELCAHLEPYLVC